MQDYFFVLEFQSGGLGHDHGLLWFKMVLSLAFHQLKLLKILFINI